MDHARTRIGVLTGALAFAALAMGIAGLYFASRPQPPSVARLALAPQDETGAAIRRMVENHDNAVLRHFYEQRGFEPAWTSAHGQSAKAEAARKLLADAGRDGLTTRYDITPPTTGSDDRARAAYDVALTRALARFAHDLHLGQVDPTALYGSKAVVLAPRKDDVMPAVTKLAADGDGDAFIAALAPQDAGYARLKTALARYRAIAAKGGWPAVTPKDIAGLQRRLAAEGYATLNVYQEMNGLPPSGKPDARSLAMLNVPAAERVAQIAANMERWRWMPSPLENRYIMVNIADASLVLMEDGEPVLTSRAVVGQPDKQTPLLAARARSVTINPVWNVPASIIRNELMPKIAKDDGYLASKNMTMDNGRVQQDPGPDNALGAVKLELPNRLDIYLHDTPAKSLFAADHRALSHGCVRVEKIRELAARALYSDPDTGPIDEMVATGQTLHKTLPAPLPVYIVYWTALTGDNNDGTIGFRADIYGRDAALIEALQSSRPS